MVMGHGSRNVWTEATDLCSSSHGSVCVPVEAWSMDSERNSCCGYQFSGPFKVKV
jgi:hypothetical protein